MLESDKAWAKIHRLVSELAEMREETRFLVSPDVVSYALELRGEGLSENIRRI
jgi:hypothetical protein